MGRSEPLLSTLCISFHVKVGSRVRLLLSLHCLHQLLSRAQASQNGPHAAPISQPSPESSLPFPPSSSSSLAETLTSREARFLAPRPPCPGLGAPPSSPLYPGLPRWQWLVPRPVPRPAASWGQAILMTGHPPAQSTGSVWD